MKVSLYASYYGIFPGGGMVHYMKLYYYEGPSLLQRAGAMFSRGSALEFYAIINK